MKSVLCILCVLLIITSCTTVRGKNQTQIADQYSQIDQMTSYSGLVTVDNIPTNNRLISTGQHSINVKVIRTISLDKKQLRQSFHDLQVELVAGKYYHVESIIEGDMLKVWLAENGTLKKASNTSSIEILFEKVFMLKDEIQDEVKRLKIVLYNRQDRIANSMKINKRKPLYDWD